MINFPVPQTLLAAALMAGVAGIAPAAAGPPAFALSAEGFTTGADVRPHNRLGLDIAEINEALGQFPPDYARALTRYAFGRHFNWRDSSHSLAFFADDYQGRLRRVLPGAMQLDPNPAFMHHFMAAALMGTGSFQGSGQRRSAADAARIAAIATGMQAIVLNWCRLELSEASIRGPQNGNWSLANGSPKNWSELFAFWWGPDGRHSLHAELTRIADRFQLPEHPTRALARALAAGQPVLLEKQWPAEEAEAIRVSLDTAALLLFLDRAADLDAAVAAGGETAAAARAALRAAWLAAGDTFMRADPGTAAALHQELTAQEAPKTGRLREAAGRAAAALGIETARFGSAL